MRKFYDFFGYCTVRLLHSEAIAEAGIMFYMYLKANNRRCAFKLKSKSPSGFLGFPESSMFFHLINVNFQF